MKKRTEIVEVELTKEEFDDLIRKEFKLEGDIHYKFKMKGTRSEAVLFGKSEDNLDSVKIWTIKESQ